jgi:hypothetical protein
VQTIEGKTYSGYTTIVVGNGKFRPVYPGVRVLISPSVEVDGAITTDSGTVDLSKSQVRLTSIEPVLASPAPVRIAADGRFSLAGVASGTYSLTIEHLPEDTYIKDGIDSLEIEPGGGTPKPLQMVLGLQGGQVTGTVHDPTGQPRFGAQVVLVPVGNRRDRPNQYRITSSALDGQFTIRGVPPGNYTVFAWEAVEPNAYYNSDYVKTYEAFGLPVRIGPGQKLSLDLAMIPER